MAMRMAPSISSVKQSNRHSDKLQAVNALAHHEPIDSLNTDVNRE
jgi:hypothetical protein